LGNSVTSGWIILLSGHRSLQKIIKKGQDVSAIPATRVTEASAGMNFRPETLDCITLQAQLDRFLPGSIMPGDAAPPRDIDHKSAVCF
jgi:hypothetical protein